MSLRPLIRLLFALALLCGLAGGARATNTCVTCYVDYVNGLDTYDGTSKTHTSGTVGPWKHAPGMLGLNQTGGSTGDGCASNCLAQVPLPGDKYILRGGTTWPYTVLPWLWTWSGTSSTQTFGCAGTGCIYIGIDATWQTGVVNALVPTKSAGGCNPSSPPTVALTGGGGIGAAATATIMPAAVNGGTYGGGGGGEPQVNGMLLYYSMGAQGSSYTSNPTATITQNGCNLETAVADIYRAVIDGGLKSGIIWPVGQNASNAWDFPGVGLGTAGSPVSYVIVDNLEIRNFLQAPRGVGTGNPDTGFAVSLLSDSSLSQHNTFSNNYVHYRTVSSCFSGCGSPQGGTGDLIMDLASYNDEAANNWLSNSESFFLGTSTTDCPLNWPCMFSASGLNAYYGGNANNGGGSIHGNHIWGARWLMEVSGFQGVSGTPVYVYGNDAWLALYDINTQPHVNGFYFQIGTATLYEYNNYLHNVVNGTNNQQAPGNPGVQYFFNNVSWQAAGGGNYGITGYGLGANGAHLYFLQNTMYASGTTGAPNACISSDNANPTDNPYLYVILQNNHCMTNYGPPWFADAAVGSTWQTSAGSTNVTDIENGTSVQTWSGSTAYYSPATLFAPQSSAAPTVTFATGGNSYNFYSICNGQPNPGLGALCFDINGNARPSTGGWNAGAYQQLSSGSVTLSPSPESFGNVNYGSSSSGVTFTLTNNSSASATSLSIGNSGGNAGDFAISSNTCGSTLAASASCTWVVTFTPGIIGSRYTTLSATYSGGDGAGSQSSLLTGVGAGTSTVNYTNVHQVIDGFGASNAQNCSSPGSMSSSVQNFFFTFLGLSIYRAGIPDNSTCFPGDCTSVSIGCASNYILDMQAQVAAGGIIYASDWSPPAIYKTNSSVNCSPGNGALATASYANYATLLANFVQSVQTYAGVTIAALSPQNEPNTCATYDSAQWNAAQLDTFIANNLGPTFAADSITTKIFMPESSQYSALFGLGNTAMTDSTALAYIGGNQFHDYDALYYAPVAGGPPYTQAGFTQGSNQWAGDGLKFWETEVSGCESGCGPYASPCVSGQWCPGIQDAMMWAAIIDNRIAIMGANAWLYWQYYEPTTNPAYSNAPLWLPGGSPTYPTSVAIRAYVMGQYAKFIRPGYSRIDATHITQTGVTVSAYKNPGNTNLVIVATNQNASSVNQTFAVSNAPTFNSATPYTTSSTLTMTQQTSVQVSGNTFTYTLPAYSVTTFIAPGISPAPARQALLTAGNMPAPVTAGGEK